MDWVLRRLADRLGVMPAGVGESFEKSPCRRPRVCSSRLAEFSWSAEINARLPAFRAKLLRIGLNDAGRRAAFVRDQRKMRATADFDEQVVVLRSTRVFVDAAQQTVPRRQHPGSNEVNEPTGSV